MDAKTTTTTQDFIGKEARYGARNYQPVPVVVDHARDCLVWDVEGREYIDMMGAYSAVSHGHLHPRLVAAAHRQLERVAVTSRAYHGTTLGPFLEKLCALAGFERALPMNTGAEAVETAIKCARRWGYRVKGIPDGQRRDPGGARQLPRPHQHHRRLFQRARIPRRLRAVRAGLRALRLRRHGQRARGHQRQYLRRAGRADPGRGRRDRAAARASSPSCANGATATTCC